MLESLIQKQQIKVVSIDVFDTALVRHTAQPQGIFMLMSRIMKERISGLSQDFTENFHYYRLNAEKTAHRYQQYGEITLIDIYDQLMRVHNLDKNTRNRIAELEIEQENTSLGVVQVIEKAIAYARELGKKIIFVSDMYLPCGVIRHFLKSRDLFKESDSLYVSSEMKTTKREGRLFDSVLALQGCRPHEILHVGDNYQSDVVQARRRGIHAYNFTETDLTRYERTLLADGDIGGQILAGAARLARVNKSYYTISDKHKTLHELGADVGGPIFTAYMIWMRNIVQELAIRRLYFVARDGQILLEIARTIFQGTGVELRYLYGSRQAWHLPALSSISSNELRWLTVADPQLTIRIFSGRIHLEPRAVQEALLSDGLNLDLDDRFTNEDVDHLKKLLLTSSKITGLILKKSSQLRDLTMGYFRQEGLLDEISWALVDLGGHGSIQESVRKILRYWKQDVQVRGFYMGLLSDPPADMSKNYFLFSPKSARTEFRIGACFVLIAEILASAEHGSVKSYEKKEDKYIPVIKARSEWMYDWGLNQLRAGILGFRDYFMRHAWMDSVSNRKRMLSIMEDLYFSPGKNEATALGEYLFSSDPAETILRPFAPILSLYEAVKYIFLFKSMKRFEITFWLHGSRVRSAWYVNYFVVLCSTFLRAFNRAADKIRIGITGQPY